MNVVQKLRQMVGELKTPKKPMMIKDSWELAERLLVRMNIASDEAERVCRARDLAGLDALVARLEKPTATAAAKPQVVVSKEDMEAALRAFRKRLKVSRLADESKLGPRQLTGGRKSEIDAILPPNEFPGPVWQALAAAGKLKHTGKGFYALPEEAAGSH